MCRARVATVPGQKPRRCPSHSDPIQIAKRNEARRKTYAAKKQTNSATPAVVAPETSTLTPEQTHYFRNSKATVDGVPITLHHGASVEFDSFDPNTLGKGNDSWGNGFYFTNKRSTAEGYAKDSKSPTANVKDFYLNLENPIYVDGKAEMSLNNIPFTKEAARRILKQHPNAYLQPSENDEEMSFLSDYSPNYWDKEEHTKAELDRMIDQVADDYFADAGWTELESVYGKDHGSAFLHAVHEETGHDGVVVDFGDDGKHYIAWFPNQIKLTSNTNPDSSDKF